MVVDDESMYEINKRDAEGVYTACMSLVFFVCPLADGWVVIDDEFLHETVNVMTIAHRPRGLIRCPATFASTLCDSSGSSRRRARTTPESTARSCGFVLMEWCVCYRVLVLLL